MKGATTMADTKTDPKRRGTSRSSSKVWSEAERAAMQEGARERKSASKRSPDDERADGVRDIRAKIAAMPSPDRELAERVHALITVSAPDLMPRTYYGMPAYARDGKTVCFFKPASKFKERYSTLGFEQAARLDDGELWPVAFALAELTPAAEARIVELVKKAAG
ncbi:MAG: iron chaperone [Verrucomicrobiota bacterium]